VTDTTIDPDPSARAVEASAGAPDPRPSIRRRAPRETYLFAATALATILVFLLADPEPPLAMQIAAIAILAAVLGMPHGALDPLIARRLGLWRGAVSFGAFNLVYTAASVAVIALWLVAPVPSLVLFLTISAVHFGGDWMRERSQVPRALAGAGLLSLPALRDQQAVADLYTTLAGEGARAVAATQAALGIPLLVLLVVVAVIAARRAPHEAAELVLIAVLALTTPPLVFFIVYFCTLHSARHLREGFAEERDQPRRLLVSVVIVYTLVPLLAAGAFLVATEGTASLDEQLLRVVFIGLAALTVPHMALVALGDRALRSTR
jgi:beta-carotene 15,15'-dioxygenase